MRGGRVFPAAAKGSHPDLHGAQDKLGVPRDSLRRRFSKVNRPLEVVSGALAGLCASRWDEAL